MEKRASGRTYIVAITLGLALVLGGRVASAQEASPARAVKCVPNVPSKGDVLITGGEDLNEDETGNTEFFHVATQQWMTGCPTKLAHDEAQMMLWPSARGMKLIEIAGEQIKTSSLGDHIIIKNTEVYDPITGKVKKGPSVPIALEDFAAVSLLDGSIMVAGGITGTDTETPVQTAAILGKSSWKKVKAKMTVPRAAPCAATMTGGAKNGMVLIVGGTNTSEDTPQLASAEIYDPAAKTFTATSHSLNAARAYPVCTALPDGTVLITGGVDDSFNAINIAEIYHPDTDTFTETTGAMNVHRVDHSANLLPDGTVLVVGGETSYTGSTTKLNSAEIYDPTTGLFAATATMNDNRDDNTATVISGSGTALDGDVLIEGGFFNGQAESTAEIYDPVAKTFTPTSAMTFAHGEANAALVP